MSSGKIVRLKDGKTREFRSKQERRQIVEETMRPGASVALVARAHGLNANQVFKWRAQYRKGRLDIGPVAALLPVKVSGPPHIAEAAPRRKVRVRRGGVIDIELGHARIRIEGTADPECIRAALDGLVR